MNCENVRGNGLRGGRNSGGLYSGRLSSGGLNSSGRSRGGFNSGSRLNSGGLYGSGRLNSGGLYSRCGYGLGGGGSNSSGLLFGLVVIVEGTCVNSLGSVFRDVLEVGHLDNRVVDEVGVVVAVLDGENLNIKLYIGFTCSTFNGFECNRYEGYLLVTPAKRVTGELRSIELNAGVGAIGKSSGLIVCYGTIALGEAENRVIVLIIFLIVNLVEFLVCGQLCLVISQNALSINHLLTGNLQPPSNSDQLCGGIKRLGNGRHDVGNSIYGKLIACGSGSNSCLSSGSNSCLNSLCRGYSGGSSSSGNYFFAAGTYDLNGEAGIVLSGSEVEA